MKITITRQQLLEAVNTVKSVVAGKSSLPILSHILLETVENNLVKVVATDLKVSIECMAECTVHREGKMTLHCQRLSMMLSELPDTEITLDLNEKNVVELTCGRIETKLFSMSPDEFPPVRSFEGVSPMRFQQDMLKKLFSLCSYAICTDQARYNLTGLLLEIKDGRLAAVATDGRRMSLALALEGVPEDSEVKVIVPSKVIHEMERLLSGDADVLVYLDASQAAFHFGQVRMVTALIEGNFPNYEMVIPKTHDKEVVVNTALMTEAMRRTRTMTNDKFNSVRIEVADNQMVLKVITPDVGEYVEEIEAKYEGEKIEIAFNPDFVLEVLRRIDAEESCLLLKDNMSPGVMKPYTEAPQDTFVNVIMPIRI